MAGPVGGGSYSVRKRVFVLVADSNVQGVFTSWDAAEQFAERNSLPLDKLMEYETPRSDKNKETKKKKQNKKTQKTPQIIQIIKNNQH